MLRIHTFSTHSNQRGHALDRWNQELESVFPGIVVDAEHNLCAESAILGLNNLAFSRIRSERATVRRWSKATNFVESGKAKLHIQMRGVSTTTQRGQTTALSAGEATFVHSDEPYDMEISDRNEMFVIEFDRTGFGLDNFLPGITIESGSVANGLLRDMALSLFRHKWDQDEHRASAAALEASVMPLLSLLQANSRERGGRHQTDLRRQVISYIDSNISDSALRTGTIANSFGLLPRDVQALFSELATTPTAYIINRRLSLAAQRLSLGDGLRSGLTNLACDLGFSDAAHFCRRFKARFGIPPGAYARARSWN